MAVGMDDGVAIRVRDVHKVFRDHVALNGVSVDVSRGEAVALIGPSGCGKSTLLRCINALEPPDRGTIEVDGQNVEDVPAAELRRRVGMVFQQFSLFPHLSVLRNLTLAPKRVLGMAEEVAREKAKELLKRVGLSEKEESLPRELSGGEAQRVAIARALMMQPSMMLFDEVTSALDPELVGEVLGVMRELAGDGMTMVVVTHEMAFAREIGDSMVFMDQGEVVEAGDPAQILEDPIQERTREFVGRILRH